MELTGGIARVHSRLDAQQAALEKQERMLEAQGQTLDAMMSMLQALTNSAGPHPAPAAAQPKEPPALPSRGGTPPRSPRRRERTSLPR